MRTAFTATSLKLNEQLHFYLTTFVNTASPGYNIRQTTSAAYNFGTAKFYDVKISCNDTETTVYSNFQVYVDKNDPPKFGNLPGKFLFWAEDNESDLKCGQLRIRPLADQSMHGCSQTLQRFTNSLLQQSQFHEYTTT